MQEIEVVIQNVTGLHARPAKIFVNAAKKFESDIRVQHNGKKVNAKSLISMIALGVKAGGQIRIITEGADEEDALKTLAKMVTDGLGEEHHKTEEKPAEKPAASTTASPPPTPAAENLIQAKAAAPGLAIGKIYKLEETKLEINEVFTTLENEQARLDEALTAARSAIDSLHQQMIERDAAEEAEIFAAHAELLADPDTLTNVKKAIADKKTAAHAWQTAIDSQAQMLAALDNPFLAARAADVRDVGERVLRHLLGLETTSLEATADEPFIVVAHDLTPSQTAALDPQQVLGIGTAAGGPTAHAAIIASALGIPAVVSAGERLLNLDNGTMIILDGKAGTITIDPDEKTLAEASARQKEQQARREEALKHAAATAVTTDGRRVEIAANIGGIEDAQKAHAASAEGAGLMRTEFLFLGRTEPPTEDEQYAVYKAIVEAMAGEPVIFRTLDIGGDKPLPYIDVPTEDNPFLGERGIRLCLNRPELLQQQLRALLRAAAHGPLRIMFPMIGNVNEWRAARQMVRDVRQELDAPDVEVGIMIEVPSAAIMADTFADEIDFFSVGTNDLTQYTLAIDRMHPTMSAQSDGLHPAVLRLIDMTVKAAHKAGKWAGVCGELGSDPAAVPILVGLGVDELSVNVPSVATTKALVRTLTYDDAQTLAQKALACATAEEVRQLAK